MSILYKASDLRKCYGDRLALSLPSFSLQKEELLIVAGPNGSGKSTLLRLLAFLEEPTSGKLVFSESSPRKKVTLLLQEPYLFNDSVFRNVTLGLKLRHHAGDYKAAFESSMCACGFSEPSAYARRFPHELSGGEKQRIALASRLIISPLALLLDEPTSSIDLASAKCIISALRTFCHHGGAVVCATHDPALLALPDARILKLSPFGTENAI